jgi:hypothetical protein
MTKTVLGIFVERENAEAAIDKLKADGYNPKDISIVMKNPIEGRKLENNTGANVAGGVVSGATTGAVLGGLAGLLASFALPGLGAFFIGGPIATALGLTGTAAATASGAATGALAGGLFGALTGFGLSEDEARTYEEQVKAGAILVAIPARIGEEDNVEQILADCNADQIRSVTAPSEDRFEKQQTTSQAVDRPVESQSLSSQPLFAMGTKGGKAANKGKEVSGKGKRD